MHYYEVAPNQIIRAGSSVFTYASRNILHTGHIVEIQVGKKTLTGIIIREVHKPQFETKEVVQLVEETPLPKELVHAALWMSDYYATPLATVLQTVLPRGLQKNRRDRQLNIHTPIRDRTHIVLNKEQSSAVEAITSMTPGSAILHGVTGSGKTETYIELTRRAIKENKSAIILVPEIALTPQLIDEFSHHFKSVILTHSRQTEAERHLAWRTVLTASEPQVIIGPRSALFLPVRSIGLIVIDEFHEPSFKQEQSPRYSALRLATILGTQHKGKIIFGSATPPIADYFLAQHSHRPTLSLTKKARENTTPPTVHIVDMTKRQQFKKHRFFSDILIDTISETLAANKQVLIFHNRRGSASTTLCENCGWIATCPNCHIPFTLHADTHILRCHVCDASQKIPTHCPVCHEVDIIYKGIGTKLIESELQKLFPNKEIARFDADNQNDDSLQSRYKEIYDGTLPIIIGTQIVAKGLDLPHLRTVAIIQADAGLALPDYSSSERTFQLLAQVVGRVGRSHHATKVIVQSYQPSHPAVQDGLSQNYTHFFETALSDRKKGTFPPYSYLLKLTCVYKTEAAAVRNAKKLADDLKKQHIAGLQILGPTPAFYEQQGGNFRWQLVLKSKKRASLVTIAAALPPGHWQFELDPISLL